MRELQEMLDMQAMFQRRLDPAFMDGWTYEQRTAYIKEHSIHLNQEINEMLYELPHFKPWKDYSNMTAAEKEVGMEKARAEMVDAWHFFMNQMLALDMDAATLCEMYFEKHAENNDRQDAGYTHDKSFREGAQ